MLLEQYQELSLIHIYRLAPKPDILPSPKNKTPGIAPKTNNTSLVTKLRLNKIPSKITVAALTPKAAGLSLIHI